MTAPQPGAEPGKFLQSSEINFPDERLRIKIAALAFTS